MNAANSSLLGGGGVDGAIHRAAGPELRVECQRLGGCETGDAKLTRGHGLLARWIAHAVGPVWRDGSRGEDELLSRCHTRSLELAREAKAASVAFPAISTGAYGFPMERAASVALRAVSDFLSRHSVPAQVDFVLFSPVALETWEAALSALRQEDTG